MSNKIQYAPKLNILNMRQRRTFDEILTKEKGFSRKTDKGEA